MQNFDREFLLFYFNMYSKGYVTTKLLLEPDKEILHVSLDIINAQVRLASMQDALDSEDKESKMYREVFSEIERFYYNDVFRKAIYYMLKTKSISDIEIVNYILKSDFGVLVSEFKKGTGVSLDIVKSYICFLVRRSQNVITKKDIFKISSSHPWIDELMFNKGYKTLNDLAREILNEMTDILEDAGYPLEVLIENFIDYFKDASDNSYFTSKFGKNKSPEEVATIKRYQFKLIVADAFLVLKSMEIWEEEDDYELESNISPEEAKILERLEDAIMSDDYSGLIEEKTLKKLFEYYICYNEYDLYRKEMTELLAENDKIYILKKANPLYFMD